MTRTRRPYLPGVAFHLTARLHNRRHLFTPVLRTSVVRLLGVRARCSDIRLLAYVIMTNHLHLVVIQGERPLGRFMQPFLTSVATLMQKRCGLEGHVFERRFADRICRGDNHLRNAIAYVHANPVRAGLVASPGQYVWSSHGAYMGLPAAIRGAPDVAIRQGWSAYGPPSERVENRRRYLEALSDAAAHKGPAAYLDSPKCEESSESQPGSGVNRLEQLLEEVAREFRKADLRSRWGTRDRGAAREAFIRRAASAGYSGNEIAACLQLSPATVSRIRNALS